MLAKIKSGVLTGVDGLLITVEIDIAMGLPTFSTVGLAEGAVRESKDRVKAAIKNSGYDFPNRRITVNLAPADIKKAGTFYDLPMAVGILAASEVFSSDRLNSYMLIGELSLDGGLRPVAGILPMVLAARQAHLEGILLPSENSAEAAIVDDIKIIAVSSLAEAIEYLAGRRQINPAPITPSSPAATLYDVDFAEVKGQAHAKRALEIAAAGGHNVLMQGPPGSGKTMLARRIPTILPSLSFEEALTTTKIYSVSGLLPRGAGLISQRPFRSPHHTISDAGLIGGGQFPKPGEVSLAHNGVLFLDEMPEFRKNVLEVLRQPLEDGQVTIARAATSLSFPACFILVAAMNPCPCGYHGSDIHECTCSAIQIQRYTSRLSGPLLDRIDMHLEVPAIRFNEMQQEYSGESSTTIKQRVNTARTIQLNRYKRHKHTLCNAQMHPRDIKKHCVLDLCCQSLLEKAVAKLGLSARAYHRILKLARTIADLAGEQEICSEHIAEAVQFRRIDRKSD